ncbi:MAG: hypothetical protein AB7H86_07920 [Blastocatellales bacterium]
MNIIYELGAALAIAVLLLVSSAEAAIVQSQDQVQRRQGTRGMAGNLGLTDEQKTSLETIRRSESEQIRAIRSDASLSNEEKRARIREIQQSTRQQSQAVLTPEQQQILSSRGRGDGRRGADPVLTDDQKQSMQTIRQTEREQIEAVRNNSSLTDEERRSQIQSIRQNSRQQTRTILTPEQQQSIGSRRGGFGGRGGRRGRP